MKSNRNLFKIVSLDSVVVVNSYEPVEPKSGILPALGASFNLPLKARLLLVLIDSFLLAHCIIILSAINYDIN